MPLLRTEAAKLSQQPIEAGVINTLAITSPVLDRLPFKTINGDSVTYRSYGTLPSVEFRGVNGTYSESTGTFNNGSEHVVILGGDADVDNFLIDTQGQTADQVAEQVTMKTLAIAYKFQDAFINGDTAVDANSFDGLKKRLTGAQVIDAATNGLSVVGTTTDDIDAFFDQLDLLIAAVPGCTPQNSAFYCNDLILARYKSAARRSARNTATVDSLGRTVNVYNDIPFIDIGNKADGTRIIPQTETMGTSSVTSSIYLVKFGESPAEQAVGGLQANALKARPLGELQTKPAQRVRIDWYPGLAVWGGRAAARLRGLKNS